MKEYLLNIYQPDGQAPPPEILQKVMRDVRAFVEETKAAGVWVFNGGLHPPSTATVVRSRRGDTLVTDGPFAEGKEHVGGFVVIKTEDLDAALGWARKLARVLTLPGHEADGGLPIEVRPFFER
ncbi:MAG: YciI family protein [Acidobacteriota bacterium]